MRFQKDPDTCGRGLRYAYCPKKKQFQNTELHSFLGPFPRFLVDILKDVKKMNCEFALEFEI